MKLTFIASLLAVSTNPLFSDLVPPSHTDFTVSSEGNAIIRFQEMPARVFVWNEKEAAYTLKESVQVDPFSGATPHIAAVNETGTVVVFFDIVRGSAGFQVFNLREKKNKFWKLEEFATDSEIKACGGSTTTIQWLNWIQFEDEYSIVISGPSRNMKGSLGSHSVISTPKEDVQFDIYIDATDFSWERDPIIEKQIQSGDGQ